MMAKLFDILNPDLKLETTYQPSSSFLLSELYKDQIVVIKFLRRFGCCLCRNEAYELSKYSRELEKLNVKLIAVGFDSKGVKNFMEGNFWRGELYLNPDRSLYQYFGFKRFGAFTSIKKLFRKNTRQAIKKSNKETKGNFKGDGFQMGGTIIIDRSGKLLYKYDQTEFEEYPPIEELLRVCEMESPKEDINMARRPMPINFNKFEPMNFNIKSESESLVECSLTHSEGAESSISSPSYKLDLDKAGLRGSLPNTNTFDVMKSSIKLEKKKEDDFKV